MEDIVNQLNGIIPQKYLSLLTALFVGSQVLGRIAQSIRSGGGLRSIIRGIWLGTNTVTPKQAAPTDPGITDKLTGLLLIGLVSFGLMFTVSGCALFKGNTPAKNAVNVSDSARITVEAALGMWDSYIVQNHPPIKQQIAVRDAWKKYQAAQLVVLDAALILKQSEATASTVDKSSAQRALSAAIGEAGQSMSDLFNLLRQFGVKL